MKAEEPANRGLLSPWQNCYIPSRYQLSMKRILLAAALLFVAFAKVHATEALTFDGDGHYLYILIGISEKPVIGDVRYTAPGAKDWVHVPLEELKIQKFDMDAQVLIMSFSNRKNDPELPPSFSFSAKKKKAVLSIKGKKFRNSFDWLDE
jgi:hypothetical protein